MKKTTLKKLVAYYNYDKDKALGAVGTRSIYLDATFESENTYELWSAVEMMGKASTPISSKSEDFIRLLCASCHAETDDDLKAYDMVRKCIARWQKMYLSQNFSKFYRQKDIGTIVGKVFNKANLLMEFGILYPDSDRSIPQRDADNREELLPELIKRLRLIATVTVINANEARIDWMMSKDEYKEYEAFIMGCGINGYSSLGFFRKTQDESIHNEERMFYAMRGKKIGIHPCQRDFFDALVKNILIPSEMNHNAVYPNVGFMPRYDFLHDTSFREYIKFPWANSNDKSNLNYGCLDAVETLEIAVKLGYVDEDTMMLKVNPNTGSPYSKRDLGNDSILEFSSDYQKWLKSKEWTME